MPHPRRLPEPLTAYRIGDAAGVHPVYNAEGARRTGGRWSAPGQTVIYASEHYATALLEKLVRLGELPPRQHSVEIVIPAGTSYEVVTEATVPGWYARGAASARAFGSAWLEEGRSAILLVPSVVARVERNVLINPAHPDAARVRVGLEQPVRWDERLFEP